MLTACGGSGSTSNSATSSGATESSGAKESSGGNEDVTYGFSLPFAELPVAATVKGLVKKDGEARGWSVLLDETKAGNIQEQTSTIETWITQGINAMTVFPTEPSAYEAIAKRATSEGIIWTTYQEEMAEGAGGATFPSKNSGEVAGKAAVKWINANDPNAEVLILNIEGAPSLEERTTIPEEMIKQETSATIVAKQAATEQAQALQVTEDVLQAHPDVSVVIGYTDDSALGAAEAFRKNGSKKQSEVYVIGEDGTEDALKALLDPKSYFRATAALDLQNLANETVNVAAEALEKGWKPGQEQNYVEIIPTVIENGEDSQIKKFLAAFES